MSDSRDFSKLPTRTPPEDMVEETPTAITDIDVVVPELFFGVVTPNLGNIERRRKKRADGEADGAGEGT